MPEPTTRCGRCGSLVEVVTSDEGTSFYKPLEGATAANEIAALEERLRQVSEALGESNAITLRLEGALRSIERCAPDSEWSQRTLLSVAEQVQGIARRALEAMHR